VGFVHSGRVCFQAYNEVDALLEEESSNFAESPCSVLAMGLSPAFSRHPLLWLITTTGVLCVSLHSLEPVASALFGEGHGRDAGHALAVGVVARCKIGAIEEDTVAVDEEEEERAAGPPQRAVVAVASPFLPEVRVLRVSCSSSSSNSSAQAAGERALSFSQRGDLPPRSPLLNFSFASSGVGVAASLDDLWSLHSLIDYSLCSPRSRSRNPGLQAKW